MKSLLCGVMCLLSVGLSSSAFAADLIDQGKASALSHEVASYLATNGVEKTQIAVTKGEFNKNGFVVSMFNERGVMMGHHKVAMIGRDFSTIPSFGALFKQAAAKPEGVFEFDAAMKPRLYGGKRQKTLLNELLEMNVGPEKNITACFYQKVGTHVIVVKAVTKSPFDQVCADCQPKAAQ